jgi:transcriptional regulator with XRE-family HTH domain
MIHVENANQTAVKRGLFVPAPTSTLTVPYLRHWRLHRLLTQGQLAALSGVSEPTIIRAESGKTVGALTATKLARALSVTVKQLQDEEPL